MKREDILNKVDHTNLKQTATYEDIIKLCEEAMVNNCASICIPPHYVRDAVDYVKGKIPVCTVIGFPNGYQTTKVKVFETLDALENGAREIDMVININMVKDGLFDCVKEEIREINKAIRTYEEENNIDESIVLKVIIETCLLTNGEIRRMCHVIDAAGADYVKTSTGFSTSGATKEAVGIINAEVDRINKVNAWSSFFNYRDKLRIKASGGIKDFEDAETYIAMGCDRLGTSRLIK